jgi:hypothetical protein
MISNDLTLNLKSNNKIMGSIDVFGFCYASLFDYPSVMFTPLNSSNNQIHDEIALLKSHGPTIEINFVKIDDNRYEASTSDLSPNLYSIISRWSREVEHSHESKEAIHYSMPKSFQSLSRKQIIELFKGLTQVNGVSINIIDFVVVREIVIKQSK